MAESANSQQMRIKRKIEEVKNDFGDAICDLLKEVSKTHLKGKGKLAAAPVIERNSLRWTLEWKIGEISFDLNVIAVVEDDGRAARVARVLVQRHASTPLEFEGHTPTTRMRRVAKLSIADIREAIEAETTNPNE
jgi:hypothetical protein